MKKIVLFILAFQAQALTHNAFAATTTYTNYNVVSNNPFTPVPPRFTDATSSLNMVANELAGLPTGLMNSGTQVNGISYDFDIYNRINPNLPNNTVGQVYKNGSRPYLAPPGVGTAFQPGGLSGKNDSVTLTFSTPITTFGVSLAIAPSSTFSIISDVMGVGVSSEGLSSYGEYGVNYSDFFLGLVSDTPFTTVTLSGGNRFMGGTTVAWSGWNATRITYNVTAVPEPASWMLFSVGIAFLSVLNRKKFL